MARTGARPQGVGQIHQKYLSQRPDLGVLREAPDEMILASSPSQIRTQGRGAHRASGCRRARTGFVGGDVHQRKLDLPKASSSAVPSLPGQSRRRNRACMQRCAVQGLEAGLVVILENKRQVRAGQHDGFAALLPRQRLPCSQEDLTLRGRD